MASKADSGTVAWYQLEEGVTEDEIYREALQLAVSLRDSISEALDSGLAKELSSIDPPDLGVQPNLRALFDPTLSLLAQARAQKLALWSDDLCTRLLVDPRGSLLQEQPLVEITARVRRTFAEVPVVGTEDVLCWLESIGELSRERRLSLLWQMHRDGYRFLGIGEVLVWLLERFRYDWNATPVKELLSDLESVATLALPNVDPKRLRFFTDIYLGDVLSQAIRGLWHSENPTLPDKERDQFSTDLLRLLERVTLQ